MRRRLVGDDVDRDVACAVAREHLREDVGGVADDADGDAALLGLRSVGARDRVVEVVGDFGEVALGDAALEAGAVDVGDEAHAVVERDGERLRATHAAAAAGERDGAGERPAEPLAGDGGEGLVGALEDALRRDVDPRTGRHLAVHHEPLGLETAELGPRGPVRHEVGVGDEHTRRPLVRRHDSDGLARLHEERLVRLEVLERLDDGVERLPGSGCAAGAAVDDEVVGALGDLGVEVVHEHAQRGFGLPALRVEFGSARCADGAGALHGGLLRFVLGVS